jgi:threonine dehydrogenase-like Zn-dependent dehydrogenase
VPLPDDIDPVAVASLSDNIPDGWRAIAPYVEDPARTSVLVIADRTPSVPFYTVAIARALGVATVDFLPWEGLGQEKAASLGANVLDRSDRIPAGTYTVTVCSAGDVEALRFALRATEPDGTCVSNTIFFADDVALPMFAMYTRGVRLVTGRVNARYVLPDALSLVTSGAFRPETVTDAVVAWDDAAQALVDKPRKLVFQR